MNPDPQRMEKIVSLCKRRGFIFQSSEIYGGLNGCWDYGPLGVELKRNVKDYWWRIMVRERDDVVGLDGAILMSRAVWKASGHEETFSDPMVDCLVTKKRFRADQIQPQSGMIHHYRGANGKMTDDHAKTILQDEVYPMLRELVDIDVTHFLDDLRSFHKGGDDWPTAIAAACNRWPATADYREHIESYLSPDSSIAFSVLLPAGKPSESALKTAKLFYEQRGIVEPEPIFSHTEKAQDTTRYNPDNGSLLTEPRAFNLMFKTFVGATEDENSVTYLRPETAQSIFVQFKNVLDTARKKLPFGIAQIGKAFRNEINPRNYIFRSREFEQMELEYFCRAEEGMKWLEYWKEERLKFYENIGIPRDKLHVLTVPDADRAFYSKGTYDIEYDFPFGRQELEGVAYRTDYDLKQHQEASGKPLDYFDEETKQRFIPHVVEPSAGVDRTVLALLCNAYDEETVTDEKGKSETRIVMRFHPRIAPVKVGVFPLLKNNEQLVNKAREIQAALRPHMNVFYDETGAIGRRYRRQDEAGTPFGITVDFETLGERDAALLDTVTLRHRDSMKQERVKISELLGVLLPQTQ
jgi:glycyl-tRNA synthetase